MKKLLAFCLAACLSLPFFVSCDEEPAVTSTSESTKTPITDTLEKEYNIKDGVLLSCVGQADENGVYTVPESVTMIAESAFAGDTSLKEVIIPSNVKIIGSAAFQSCTSLKKVTMEEGVETVGTYAFLGCTSLEEVKLPSTVKRLEDYAFYGCEAMAEITLTGVREIGTGAFIYCASLEDVTFSEELTWIEPWAFAQCANLFETNIGTLKNLHTIGDYAFSGCSMLLSIEIPEGVQSIGKLAFYECTRLADVKIGSTVTKIDTAAFNYTPWYRETSAEYLIVGDGVLIKCNVHPEYIDLSNKGIKHIGANAFWNAEHDGESSVYGYKYTADLVNIEIPDTVETIGTSAFSGCYNLGTIVLPAGIKHIGEHAFNIFADGYTFSANIDISACTELQTIGAHAFYGCGGISSMELPESVTEIGSYAFSLTGAHNSFLEKASKSDKEEDHYFITGDNILLAAYVPDGKTKITVPDGVKIIAGGAFMGWDSAYIPDSVDMLTLSGRTKYNISYTVEEFVLPDTVTVIGDMAFYRALTMKSFVIPDSVTFIGKDAFSFCDALSSISGGANVETVSDYAFYYCRSLPGFSFSSNTTSIGTSVFGGCISLKTVNLPRGLSHPGTELFSSECTALETVNMDPSARPLVYTVLGGIVHNVSVRYYAD